jgi:hypothetical protein
LWQRLSFPKIQMVLKGRMSIDITMIEVNLRDGFAKFQTMHFTGYFKW